MINVHLADEARHAWALGRRSIEEIVTAAHRLARHRPDAKADVEPIHFNLMVLMQLLHEATVASANQANCYSDGSPVAIQARLGGGDSDELPWQIYKDFIDDYWPVPPGWELVIAEPPHRRGIAEHMDSVRQLWQPSTAYGCGGDE